MPRPTNVRRALSRRAAFIAGRIKEMQEIGRGRRWWGPLFEELRAITVALEAYNEQRPPGTVPQQAAKRYQETLRHIATPGRCPNPQVCASEALAGVD